jgi:hypothetical protein
MEFEQMTRLPQARLSLDHIVINSEHIATLPSLRRGRFGFSLTR